MTAAVLAAGPLPVAVGPASAATPTPSESLLADFTFDTAPVDGAFRDRGAVASVRGAASLVDGQTGQGKAANVSQAFWLDLTASDGQPLLKGRDSITLSWDSRPSSSGNVGWAAFAARTADRQEYAQEKYVGVLDRTDGIIVERYANTAGRDSSGNLTGPSSTSWKHVDLVLSGTTARLFVDREPVAVSNRGRTLTEILGVGGGVFQIGKANWGGGEYFSGLIDNFRIYDRALTGAELGVEATDLPAVASTALAVPQTILGDLPSSVLGKTVTWTATGPGASRIGADGGVDTSGLGTATLDVRVEARVEGEAQTSAWNATVAEPGGRIATYVKTVTTTDGKKDDPLAYEDDRRSDALFVAALPRGAADWEPLNRGQAILYVSPDGSQQARPDSQVGSPSVFRAADGRLGAVSSQNNATDSVYVWTSTDGRSFANQRTLRVASGAVVSDPYVVFDTASSKYKLFWTDLLTGEGRVTVFDTLDAEVSGGATSRADARTLGVDGAGIPPWAAQSQASEVALTASEFSTFYASYVDLLNTGVKPLASGRVAQGAGAAEVAAALPKQATMEYNDGSTKNLDVIWQTESLSRVDTSAPGTYEVQGTVKQAPEAMVSDARADPHVFFNPDDGYYYLTGSHYGQPSTGPVDERQSYRKIGLKRATTIEGLDAAPEQIVVDPDAGTPGREGQYPNTHYGWGGWIWAQEFHKINGTWWIVAGMNRGYQVTQAWCDNTVLIPYTGTDASIKEGGFLNRANWGEPVVLEGAPFDVNYYERQENGQAQGYWILPSGNTISIAKAKMGPKGTLPLIDGSPSRIYAQSHWWEFGKQAPTPSDTVEGGDQPVVEAPYLVKQGDRVYITYSGGTVDKYYSIGMLNASADADLRNPASWTSTAYPVLSSNDTADGRIGADEKDYTRQQAGTGHNSFVTDSAGNLVLAYHARPFPDPHTATDPNGAGGLFDPDRNTWFKSVNVRANGLLDLSLSKDQEVAPANRTVTASIVVKPSAGAITATAVPRCVAGKVTVTVTAKNSGTAAASVSWATPWGTRTQQIAAGASAALTVSTRAASVESGTLTGTATVGTAVTPVSATYKAATCN